MAIPQNSDKEDPLLGDESDEAWAKFRTSRPRKPIAPSSHNAPTTQTGEHAGDALSEAPFIETKAKWSIATSPKRYTLNEQDFTISFRHPWAIDEHGRGALIRRGVKLLTVTDRGNFKTEVQSLLDAAPRTYKEIPDGVRDELIEVYFAWIKKAAPRPINVEDDTGNFSVVNEATGEIHSFDVLKADSDVQEQISLLKRDKFAVGIRLTEDEIREMAPFRRTLNEKQMLELYTILNSYRQQVSNIKNEKAQVESERDDLIVRLKSAENQIRQLAKDAGARLEHERSITLRQCVEHFKQRWNPPGERTSGGQKIDMINRIERVADAIGLDIPYASITRDQIRKTISELKKQRGKGVIADNTKIGLRQAIKTFCTFLTWSPENDGMGLSLNPTQGLSVGSKQAVQQRKQKRGEIEVLDPRPLLKYPEISLYYKSVIGVLGFAGLRLSEAAALRWSDIDFDQKLVRVIGWEIYPNRKTVESERVVKPFPNLWPLLEQLKKERTDDKILFPRLYMRIPRMNRDGSPWKPDWTWLTLVLGRVRARDLSSALKAECRRAWDKALKRDEELEKSDDFKESRRLTKNEPAFRLRRFWSNMMDEQGLSDLEVMMGGHSGATSNAYYKKQMDKIVKANVPVI